VPNLVTAGSLSIKLEPASFELSNDFAIAKTRESAHLCSHDDRVIAMIRGYGKRDFPFALATGFNEFPSDVPRNIEGLRDCPPLRYQTRKFVGSGQIHALRQLLNLNSNGEFHFQVNCTNADAAGNARRVIRVNNSRKRAALALASISSSDTGIAMSHLAQLDHQA
jgi:hypothetical protein